MKKYIISILIFVAFFNVHAIEKYEDFLTISFNFITSRALYVAADLNIADILKQQSCSLQQLSETTGTHADALERLLRILLLHNIIMRDQQGLYHATELSDYMCEDHPKSIRPLLLHEDPTRWNCYGNLKYSIKTGKPVFDHLYQQSYFSYLEDNPLLNQRFQKAMTTISDQEEEIISDAYPFDQYPVIADIGGGRGGMMNRILKKHFHVRGILADLPGALQTHILADAVAQRVSMQGIDFFEPLTINADLFILKRVLHDWDEAKSIEILKNIAHTMKTGSRLLVIEAVVGAQDNQAQFLAQVDLLLLALGGGRERTLAEFNSLINAAGLKIVRVISTNSLMTLIECARIEDPI